MFRDQLEHPPPPSSRSPQAFDFDIAAFHHETVAIGDLPDNRAILNEGARSLQGMAQSIKLPRLQLTRVRRPF
jgi:hypothetical protein